MTKFLFSGPDAPQLPSEAAEFVTLSEKSHKSAHYSLDFGAQQRFHGGLTGLRRSLMIH